MGNEAYCFDVAIQIKTFFKLNIMHDTSPSTIWSVHKASVQGFLIQLSPRVKKACNLVIEQKN